LSSQEVAEAVVEWAREQLPELNDGHPHPISESGDLPDVVAAVAHIRSVPGEPEKFPFAMLEQTWLKVYDIELSIMVEQEQGNEGEKAAQQQLEAFAETLLGSTLADATLGERVPMVSPFLEADFSEPFRERSDGLRGRTMFMTLTVGELLAVQP
jgi:hypothetical protein